MMLVISLTLLFAQLLEQGIAEFHRGDYIAARSTLARAPASPARNVFLALAEAATGGCEGAIPRLEQRQEDPQLRRLAGLGLIGCLLAQDQLIRGLEVAASLQKEFPSDADVLYQTARLHMRAFNDVVQRMFERTPASFRVNQLSAEIFELHGRHSEAISEFRKAIAKNPIALNLHYRLGRLLALESKYDEALHEFEAELKLNPSDALAHYQVGQILALQQKNEEAGARFEQALKLQPDLVEAMVALARLRPRAAIPLLEKAVALSPRHEPARYALMIAYRNAGRLQEAEQQKAELDKLIRPPEGEFTEFLKKLGESPRQ
jgi:tetratricopeptide (TPR) repeat protein